MWFMEETGRWEYFKKRSSYHFDPEHSDDSVFRIIGRFRGIDWSAELENLIERFHGGTPLNFYNKLPDKTKPHTYEMDALDMQRAGYPENPVFLRRITPPLLNPQTAPILFKMVRWFGFAEAPLAKIHIQSPGQVFPFHMDDLTGIRGNSAADSEDHNQWARIEVQLKPWEWGHVWAVGNTYWKQWQAGEIMFHPWHGIPHGTANCGMSPRITLQISGKVSEQTLARLNQNWGNIDLSDTP